MRRVRAAVTRSPGEFSIEEVELAGPMETEVMVEIKATGVCHTDYRAYNSDSTAFPIVLGHEGAGVIEETGSAVSSLEVGDRVVIWAWPYCGKCEFCNAGTPYLCRRAGEVRGDRMLDGSRRLHDDAGELNHFFAQSSFASKVVVSELNAVKIPESVEFEVAAPLACGFSTGVGAVMNTAGVRGGETVAVIGCGGVGASAVLAAKAVGAGEVIAVDVHPGKLDLLADCGVSTIDASATDPVTEIKALTGDGVDYAFECIGGRETTTQQAFESLRPGGTVVVTGTSSADPIELAAARFIESVGIKGNVLGSVRPKVDLPRYLRLYDNGELDLATLVTETYNLSELDAAMDALGTRSIKGVITF